MDTELTELLAAVEQAGIAAPVGFPTATPSAGQARDDWEYEVARLREQHNAQALELLGMVSSDNDFDAPAEISYAEIPVADATITARIYTPPGPAPHAGLLFLHGGGWWIGGGASNFLINDELCREACSLLGAVVVNADYRLAPEHPYPGQLEDAYASLVWMQSSAQTLGIDPERLSVLGISSGGNLTAAVSMLSRDRGGPQIRAQLFLVPALDITFSSPKFANDPEARALTSLIRSYYAQQHDPSGPYLSPALAEDLAGMPPAEIIVGEFDHPSLREGADAYARRLTEAGVTATVRTYPMTHSVATPEVRGRWSRELFEAARGHLRPVAERSGART